MRLQTLTRHGEKVRLQLVLPRHIAKDVRRAAVEAETTISNLILSATIAHLRRLGKPTNGPRQKA